MPANQPPTTRITRRWPRPLPWALSFALLTAAATGTDLTDGPGPYAGTLPPTPRSKIDHAVFGRLQSLGIQPARLCPDAVFVRRAFLDTIGTLPTAAEVSAFIQDSKPDKRDALIDMLLERAEFADFWAMKWCDLLRVKSEFPINLWPNAVQAYHHWIHTAIRDNMPYDRFVREMLTASGSNFRVPQVNFYRAVQNRNPRSVAEAVALSFMGARADKWPDERVNGMAAFFGRVSYKSTSEWKEEIIYFDLAKAITTTTDAIFPDGTRIHIPPGQDPREVFANWLITPANPWFTRSITNRVWTWLLGRGITEETDDIRSDNPPGNPELAALLESGFAASHYDLKQLYRTILKSQVYQLSCVPASDTPVAARNFASYPLRRLDAEVFIDAINQITGQTEKYTSPIPEPFSFIPESQRSIALADASIDSPFLSLFGRSSRDTGLESERDNSSNSAQCLHLLNSSHIRKKIGDSSRIRTLLQAKSSPREMVDTVYLTVLSRHPSGQEAAIAGNYKPSGASAYRAGLDLVWALINTAEFQFRH